MSIIAVVFILLLTFSSGNIKMFKMLGGIFGILTIIFTLIAPIYFMTTLPDALSSDSSQFGGGDIAFWDEVNIFGMKISFGPSIAWYLMIVSFVTALIASIIVFMEKPGIPMPSNPMQQQPRPPQ